MNISIQQVLKILGQIGTLDPPVRSYHTHTYEQGLKLETSYLVPGI